MLGLRAIYTLTVVLINSFQFLQHGVALLLAFIGAKIALDVLFGVVMPTRFVLLVILGTLGGAMLGSIGAARLRKWRLQVPAQLQPSGNLQPTSSILHRTSYI